MALADLMKRGFLTSATATPAIPATHRRAIYPTVATVAGVAVAKPKKAETNSMREALALFEFDSIPAEIDAGYPEQELHRVNNMAWEFMQTDQMTFNDAIRLAAEIVVKGKWNACEAAYVDVMALFNRLQSNDRKSS